jgi:hypothetical protein
LSDLDRDAGIGETFSLLAPLTDDTPGGDLCVTSYEPGFLLK